jgi:hypothetical protein
MRQRSPEALLRRAKHNAARWAAKDRDRDLARKRAVLAQARAIAPPPLERAGDTIALSESNVASLAFQSTPPER